MAPKLSLISIVFLSSLLLNICFARNSNQQQQVCLLNQLDALEPTSSLKSEGGFTEYWNPNDQQFQCAGVAFLRHTIRPKSLLLPSLTNSPLVVVITQGRGYFGAVLPGCPETFISPQDVEEDDQNIKDRHQDVEEDNGNIKDRHQKIRHFREGDLIVLHPGIVHWVYNSGDQDLVAVAMLDTANKINQLDNIPQRSYIFGNPQAQAQGQHGQEQQFQGGNILRGIRVETLQRILRIDQETATKLQGEWDQRGHIIRVEQGLQVTSPRQQSEKEQEQEGQEGQQSEKEQEQEGQEGQQSEKEQEQEGQKGRGSKNGLEETICSQRMVHNLNDPAQADIYNPRAGHLISLNSHDLPILRDYKLSAEKGHLHRNAIMAPHWTFNAHTIIYGIDGAARIQIVNNQGEQVFDDRLQQGQILVVPQNYMVVKEAGNQGFRWVGFKTNDNAMINTIAGRHSTFTGLPVNVLANILQISEREAFDLKFKRKEHLIFSSRQQSESE